MFSWKPVTAVRFSGGTPNSVSPSCTRDQNTEPRSRAGRNSVWWVPQTKSPRGPSSSRQGSDWMQPLNVCLTGLMPTASLASWSVSRTFRNPSPFSELSRKRFCATVSSTAVGSGSSDFTRRPSTTSDSCSPSRP